MKLKLICMGWRILENKNQISHMNFQEAYIGFV